MREQTRCCILAIREFIKYCEHHPRIVILMIMTAFFTAVWFSVVIAYVIYYRFHL